MIEDISHITFIVSDLDRMTDILETVFDAKEVYASGEKPFSHSPEKILHDRRPLDRDHAGQEPE
jgi:catechol 2,3-dioxygenase-like lactoylglutathione lyase family enzyme